MMDPGKVPAMSMINAGDARVAILHFKPLPGDFPDSVKQFTRFWDVSNPCSNVNHAKFHCIYTLNYLHHENEKSC
jgi:hypothetical protein